MGTQRDLWGRGGLVEVNRRDWRGCIHFRGQLIHLGVNQLKNKYICLSLWWIAPQGNRAKRIEQKNCQLISSKSFPNKSDSFISFCAERRSVTSIFLEMRKTKSERRFLSKKWNPLIYHMQHLIAFKFRVKFFNSPREKSLCLRHIIIGRNLLEFYHKARYRSIRNYNI